ncbi:F0F1 ATP synthase subunit epsilon [Kaarinaea lacus]
MNSFSLILRDATHEETFDQVTSFIGEDNSGSFGIFAHHDRLMSATVFGLARFRIMNEPWQYLAMPGALLYFNNNELSINTRRYFLDSDYQRISAALQEQLLAEEESLRSMKESLHYMEKEILRRMWELGRNEV